MYESILILSLFIAHAQPMSKQTREYILNLNIEKDARILKERLNICSKALDYFCASCSILKAGAKAGLTLYDIAVMCCRNDNLGEVPSKLEILFSMAAELAESAVENGRWGHAAASRALAEQLTPKGGSLLSPNNSKPLQKAVSALNLPNYSHGGLTEEGSAEKKKKDPMPGMIQSSASDSSSDSVDGPDGEECEEWAAALIADVSLEQSIPLLNVKPRSLSIQSDESSDSGQDGSPKGFWTKSPGPLSDDGFDDFDDEDSLSWGSPPSTSFLDSSISSFAAQMNRSFNPFDKARRPSVVLAPLVSDRGEAMQALRSTPSKVTFSDCTRPEKPPRKAPKDERMYKHCNSDVGESTTVEMPKRGESKMKRSQSYSALSSTSAEKRNSETEIGIIQPQRPHDHEQYRDYFLKFVDLVIVRETTAAARQTTEN